MMLVLLSMLRLLLPLSLLALLLMLLLLPPLPANAAIELAFSCSANHVRKGACTSSQNCQTRRSSHPPEQTRISIQLQILGLAFGIEGLWVSGSGHAGEATSGKLFRTTLVSSPSATSCSGRSLRQASSRGPSISKNSTPASRRCDWFACYAFLCLFSALLFWVHTTHHSFTAYSTAILNEKHVDACAYFAYEDACIILIPPVESLPDAVTLTHTHAQMFTHKEASSPSDEEWRC